MNIVKIQADERGLGFYAHVMQSVKLLSCLCAECSALESNRWHKPAQV